MLDNERTAKARSMTKSISVDESVFALMASAINVLSLKNHRFESLATVVEEALTFSGDIPNEVVASLPPPKARLGRIKVHFRMYDYYESGMERMRERLAAAGRAKCSLRDIIIVCCLLTIPSKP